MNRIKDIFRGLFVVVALCAMSSAYAQVDSLQTDSLEIHNIKGKEYYIHVVEKGGSLYAIHKKYNVPIEIIKKENPSVLDGLSIGEKVFIPVKRNVTYEVKTDGNYINHVVKKKQTLYAIAKLYDVKQKAVVAANPEISGGLKEGQEIRIPVKNIKKEEAPKVLFKDKKYQTHTVEKGETLYALSKKFGVTVRAIQDVNGGLSQGLILGEKIYIPIQKNEEFFDNETEKKAPLTIDSISDDMLFEQIDVVRKDEYAIALFLPFYLDANDEMVENRNALDKESVYPKSKFAIEFYNGVKMALDSISADSCSFKLYVYDTNGNDSLRIKKLLLKPEIQNLDLIIGPLYYDNFKRVSRFAYEHKIPIVSPVKQSNKLLLGNQFIFKAIPSKSTTIKQFSTLAIDSFKTENLMAIAYSESKEKPLVDLYIKAYNEKILNSEDTAVYSTVKTLNVNKSFSEVINNLHPTKNNVIFVPASNQTFVTNLFNELTTLLNQKKYEDYSITLLGLEEWMKFENIDLPYFQKLNVHYCSARFVNDEDSLVKEFVSKYVHQNNTYPTKNTFLGFDLASYLGTKIATQGTMYLPSELLGEYKGLSINLNFFKTGVESGFENIESFLLRFEDFTLKRIN